MSLVHGINKAVTRLRAGLVQAWASLVPLATLAEHRRSWRLRPGNLADREDDP